MKMYTAVNVNGMLSIEFSTEKQLQQVTIKKTNMSVLLTQIVLYICPWQNFKLHDWADNSGWADDHRQTMEKLMKQG